MHDRLGNWLLRHRIAVVEPHLRGRVLDLGCGSNQLVRAYRASAAQPGASDSLGVDVYPWEGVDLVVEDTAALPFESGAFDTVTIIAALNHIPEREAVLRETVRVLRPGGRIVVTMIPPGISRVWHLLRRPWDADQSERGVKEGEVWGLTPQAVDALLQQAGYRLTAAQRFMAGINRLRVATLPEDPRTR